MIHYKHFLILIVGYTHFVWHNTAYAELKPVQQTTIHQEQAQLSLQERLALAKKYIDENKGKEALDLLKPILDTTPNFDVFIMAAQAYAERNDPTTSLYFYEKAQTLAKTQVEVQITHAGIAKMHDWLSSLNTQKNIDIEKTVALAKKYILENKGQKALTTLKKLPSTDNFEIWILYAQAYAEISDPASALSFYQKANIVAKTTTENTVAKNGIMKMNHWLELMQKPVDYSKTLDLARKYIIANKGHDALEVLKEPLKQAPTYPVFIMVAQSYAILEDPAHALYYYTKASTLAHSKSEQNTAQNGITKMNQWLVSQSTILPIPTALTKAIDLARQYIEADKGAEALKLLSPFLDKNPNYDVFILVAQSYAAMNEPEKALSYFEKGLSIAKTKGECQVADSGIKKMKAWLSQAKTKITHMVSPLDKKLDLVRAAITQNQGLQALKLLRPLLGNNPRVDVYFLAAQTYAILNEPFQALQYYQRAYAASTTPGDKLAAQFGIAKMQFWMSFYYSAVKTYNALLIQVKSKEDYEIALAGKVKSLAYMDRPMRALRSIPLAFDFTKPAMVIAAAQASLWSGWPDITRTIAIKYASLLKTIPAQSPLHRDLKDLVWQMNLATWPNALTGSAFISRDSEGFEVNRETVDYTRYWSQAFQTAIGLIGSQYRQRNFLKLENRGVTFGSLQAKAFYLKQTWKPSRALTLNAQIEPTNYQLWNPFLWDANIRYRPNDYFGLNFYGIKNVVETLPAFIQHISANQVGTDVVLNWIPYVQLNGSLNQMHFTDQNVRKGYYLSASAIIFPSMGISLIYQKRGFGNKFVSRYYFSPDRYVADTVILRLSSKAGSVWHYYLDGGLGSQRVSVTGTESKPAPTYQWGFGINGPIRDWLIFSASYYMTTQASSFIDAPNYRYQTGFISLTALL